MQIEVRNSPVLPRRLVGEFGDLDLIRFQQLPGRVVETGDGGLVADPGLA